MDWKVIALIVSLCLNAIFLIRQFAGLLSDLKKLGTRLVGWLLKRPTAFKQRRWWNKYRPSWEIINKGKLRITKFNNEYHMQLKIEVKYTSIDNRFYTLMDINDVYLDVYNLGKDRDSKPYRLCRSDSPLKIHPINTHPFKGDGVSMVVQEDDKGGFPVVPLLWKLPCGENVIIRYALRGHIDAKPLVETSAFCKIVAIGKAGIEGLFGNRELKVGDKFSVVVDKEYEE